MRQLFHSFDMDTCSMIQIKLGDKGIDGEYMYFVT